MLIEQVIMILKKLRIRCLKDEMHWPPQPSDLEPEKFNRHSVAQDIVYIATNGRVSSKRLRITLKLWCFVLDSK